MLIYSQNKNIIINFANVINICIGYDGQAKESTIYCSTEELTMPLGTYSSVERCREVLEEILDFYVDIQQVHSVYTMPEE